MRTDDDVVFPGLELCLSLALLLRAHRAGEPADTHAERGEHGAERRIMLLGEDLRRRHESAHISVFGALPHKCRRDKRFAAADIALHEAVHHSA